MSTDGLQQYRRPASNTWEHVRGPVSSRLLLEIGVARGADPRRLVVGTGLQPRQLTDPTTPVTAGQELRIAENLRDELGDLTGVGVEIGRQFTLGDLGIWAYAIMSSATYGEALDVGLRFSRLTPAFVAPELDDHTSSVDVVLHDEHLPVAVRDLFVERDLAAMGRLLESTGMKMDGAILETRFADEIAATIGGLYADVRVRGGGGGHRLRIPAGVIDRAMPMADANTRLICERECERLLETVQQRAALSAIVRARLVRTPDVMPSLDELAREMHTSVRSLRRRLEEEQTSYRALREEVVETLAIELLGTVGLPVGDVARRLGYAEASSFTRAFTRWTGRPPSSFRPSGSPRGETTG